MEIQFKWLYIFLKAKGAHSPDQVIPIDSLPLLSLAFVACPAKRKLVSEVIVPFQGRSTPTAVSKLLNHQQYTSFMLQTIASMHCIGFMS